MAAASRRSWGRRQGRVRASHLRLPPAFRGSRSLPPTRRSRGPQHLPRLRSAGRHASFTHSESRWGVSEGHLGHRPPRTQRHSTRTRQTPPKCPSWAGDRGPICLPSHVPARPTCRSVGPTEVSAASPKCPLGQTERELRSQPGAQGDQQSGQRGGRRPGARVPGCPPSSRSAPGALRWRRRPSAALHPTPFPATETTPLPGTSHPRQAGLLTGRVTLHGALRKSDKSINRGSAAARGPCAPRGAPLAAPSRFRPAGSPQGLAGG